MSVELLKFKKWNTIQRTDIMEDGHLLSDEQMDKLQHNEDEDVYYFKNGGIVEVDFETGIGRIIEKDYVIYTKRSDDTLTVHEEKAIISGRKHRAWKYFGIDHLDWLILLDLKVVRRYVLGGAKSLENLGVVEVSVEEAEKYKQSSYRNGKYYVHKKELEKLDSTYQ